MAVLPIRLVPDPVLFRKARKVAKILPHHHQLAADMTDTLAFHQGIGLAANQVGQLERLVVVQTPELDEPLVLLNPEIVRKEGEREVEEGCLSVPGFRGMVTRAEKIRAKGLGLDAKAKRIDAEELLAQALEHEIDHLNGITYLEHLLAHTKLRQVAEARDGSECEDGGDPAPPPPPERPPLTPEYQQMHRWLHQLNLLEHPIPEHHHPHHHPDHPAPANSESANDESEQQQHHPGEPGPPPDAAPGHPPY